MRPFVAASTIGLLASIAAFGGCGGDDQPERASAPGGKEADQGVTQRNDATIEQSQGGGTQQTRQKLESSSRSSGGSSLSSSQSSSDGTSVQTVSGTGDATIGVLTAPGASRLSWTNTGGRLFTLKDGSGRISISSRAGRGEIPISAGTYRDVRVNGDVWTVTVRPR